MKCLLLNRSTSARQICGKSHRKAIRISYGLLCHLVLIDLMLTSNYDHSLFQIERYSEYIEKTNIKISHNPHERCLFDDFINACNTVF